MRKPTFSPEAWEDFLEWAETDVKVMRKILSLIDAAAHTPFDGIGKPEALKHNLKGYWSRRITKEHRLVIKLLMMQYSSPNVKAIIRNGPLQLEAGRF